MTVFAYYYVVILPENYTIKDLQKTPFVWNYQDNDQHVTFFIYVFTIRIEIK